MKNLLNVQNSVFSQADYGFSYKFE
uniref:Uncharacterized protein n=1 Tax=Anguilla anguilla TaxID=7936 RepID=A0A0E9XS74_ANGAN